MGHLEASSAAAALASLFLVALNSLTIAANAQMCRSLERRAAHLATFMKSRLNGHLCSFMMSGIEVCTDVAVGPPVTSFPGRLSSFGFSGTISHA